MQHATVIQTRCLGDGRRLVQLDACPHCGGRHWCMTDGGSVAFAPCGRDRPVLIGGTGSPNPPAA